MLSRFRFIIVSFLSAIVLLIALDLYLHFLLKSKGGYNIFGYRGEWGDHNSAIKIGCFGGSTTYGFGVNFNETWPYYLEQSLNIDGLNVTVYNLGANGQGIKGIYDDLDYYHSLDLDIVLIYSGYNDLNPRHVQQYSMRKEDVFFETFGYKPILMDYLNDKLLLSDGLQKKKLRFTKGQGLNYHQHVKHYIIKKDSIAVSMKENGEIPFKAYGDFLNRLVKKASAQGTPVIFMCPPGLQETQQQKVVQKVMEKDYIPYTFYTNEMANLIDLLDTTVSIDGMHLNKRGNKSIALSIKSWLIAHDLINK